MSASIRSLLTAGLAALALPLFVGCDGSTTEDGDGDVVTSMFGIMAGGEGTVFRDDIHAFDRPAENLEEDTLEDFLAGELVFGDQFGTPERPGLGPVFNGSACESCHFNAGRGPSTVNLARISVPGSGTNGEILPVSDFGGQLQNAGFGEATAEGQIAVVWSDVAGTYGDGTPYTLRAPEYSIAGAYTTLPGDELISSRAGPVLAGLGLLEAIAEADILALADPDDENEDGISGKANMVWDETEGELALGRFGWKAEAPNLRQQSAGAFNQDMGVTSPLFPTEACAGQAQDDGLMDDPEIDAATLDVVEVFIQTLGVPARRNVDDPQVLQGEALFMAAGCAGCHVPVHTTGNTHPIVELRNQTIVPFTDLLLHDMGPGLSDNRPTFLAEGSEWRTAPLWGLGLIETVNGHTELLHDGRARSIAEAILWHGGEAEEAKEFFRMLDADDRAALIAFLESN